MYFVLTIRFCFVSFVTLLWLAIKLQMLSSTSTQKNIRRMLVQQMVVQHWSKHSCPIISVHNSTNSTWIFAKHSSRQTFHWKKLVILVSFASLKITLERACQMNRHSEKHTFHCCSTNAWKICKQKRKISTFELQSTKRLTPKIDWLQISFLESWMMQLIVQSVADAIYWIWKPLKQLTLATWQHFSTDHCCFYGQTASVYIAMLQDLYVKIICRSK